MDSKKTQKIVVIILVVTALLGIVGAFLVYYLSTQDDTQRIDREQKEYCACVKAYTTPDCNDCSCTQIESQALESKIGEVIDGVCSLDCSPPEVVEEEEPNRIIECLIPQVRESNCHSISVRNVNTRDLVVPPVSTENPALITADFVQRMIGGEKEEFTKFVFIVNGVTTEVSSSEVASTMIDGEKTYVPEIEFSNFEDIDTLTVQVVGHSDRDPDGGSPSKYCYRQYDLTQTRGALCSSLIANAQEGPGPSTTIINRMELNTPSLGQDDEISIAFSFDSQTLDSVRTQVFPPEVLEEILVNETIFLETEHLYSTPNLFVGGETFPVFDNSELQTDSIRISAQVYANDTAIDSSMCTENVRLLGEALAPDPEPEAPEPEEPDPEEPEDEEPDPAIEHDILLTMEGPTCVRKAEDENSVSRTNYRITVTNNSEIEEEITNITNKLPFGFKYIEGTTTINGVLVEDNILDITTIGESQELAWSNDWTMQENSSLIIEYSVNVTHNAIDGENQNEAVVSPVNIPEDMSRLRAEVVTLVSDECEHEEALPETGNLTFISFIVGIFALIFGILVYQGRIDFVNTTMLKLVNTRTIKKRLMSTQEYFEDQILEDEEKD